MLWKFWRIASTNTALCSLCSCKQPKPIASTSTMRNPVQLVSPSFYSTLFFFLLVFLFTLTASETQNFLERGSSLFVEDASTVLSSPDNSFTCGFHEVGNNAFGFGIWFTHSSNRTIVWTANRDKPVNGHGSRVSLRGNGAMVLIDVDGSIAWETNTSSTNARRVQLLNSGNLVLKDPHGKILWQTFDHPTDTLLPSQIFTKGKKLTSALRKGGYASGYYSFYFDNDNVMRLIYEGPEISSLYWPNPDFGFWINGRTNYNSSRIAVLDDMGRFLSSDQLQFNATDMGLGLKRRLTMDYDGNLRLYSLNSSTGLWDVTWEALAQQCHVHGLCGRNGVCVYAPEPKCSCPPGYEATDPSDWNQGCRPRFKQFCSNSQVVKFLELESTDFYGFDLSYVESISFEECKELCLEDCRCEAFGYRLQGRGVCFPKIALFNGYRSPVFEGSTYLKLPATVEGSELPIFNATNLLCNLSDVEIVQNYTSLYLVSRKRFRWVYLYSFASAVGAIEILLLVGCLFFGRQGLPSSIEHGYHVIISQFRRFTYRELKSATGNFKEELGKGGSGAVYRGVLSDERVVAVKRLGDSIQGEEVFWAEVTTIGKINHMNLVRMWGFCCEGKHRLLVYEYVENRSLDRHLFSENFLGWNERFKVAVGTAKALAYLHHEYLEWVIHCDVKPENILLDRDYEPKVSDFGLAKLAQRGGAGSEFTRIRGTKGYMAPEWAVNLPITAKVDVYSYGVVILEIVRGIRLSNWVGDNTEEQEAELTRFVRIVKRKIQCGEEWLEDVVDPRLEGQFNKNQAIALVETGLLCIEEDRNKRPAMGSVVQVLMESERESFNEEFVL